MTLEELAACDVGLIRPGSLHAARFPDQAQLDSVYVPTLGEVASLLFGYPKV